MADLPLPPVLAGPIVRRVEPQLASFWIALSDSADAVTVTIWRGIQTAGATGGSVASGDAKVASATVKTRRFGKRLHVAMIRACRVPGQTGPHRPGQGCHPEPSDSG